MINFTPGQNPEFDAFYAIFFIENHLDHSIYPDEVASPEQIGFMVYMKHEKIHYYPCTDEMFHRIISRSKNPELEFIYSKVKERIFKLVDDFVSDEEKKPFLKALLSIKFDHETRDLMMIPSRLEKRLFKIFINQSGISDPYFKIKAEKNMLVRNFLESNLFKTAIDNIRVNRETGVPDSLSEIRRKLEYIELRRFIALIGQPDIFWDKDHHIDSKKLQKCFDKKFFGNGVKDFFSFLGIEGGGSIIEKRQKKKLMWLADEAGEVILDIRIVNYLASLGHKVFLVFKEAPIYSKVDITDAEEDETLKSELSHSEFVYGRDLSKNEIISYLQREKNVLVISDGTQENLNLLKASTTFARAFKECDAIISRGIEQKRRFFDTHFEFTRPVFNISHNEDGFVVIALKAAHPEVIRFRREDLEKKAAEIIEKMRTKKESGSTVMFYSGIIGSIPGKIDEATEIMSTFISYLEQSYENTFIINPSKYYESGMDADDLMYMWEIVQRSGYIDIWRFQSYDDIAYSFKLLGKKVPPEWVGKDSTYSTGCTKEMAIALSVLERNPEMQLTGPSTNKFMRRRDYGVGKMYDRILSEV
ncbi:MAG: hypothetical protein RBR53_08370 [Desulforegulaceae bacterium]|nr:hypothetical protein [Desulforegulaceae bacterium]